MRGRGKDEDAKKKDKNDPHTHTAVAAVLKMHEEEKIGANWKCANTKTFVMMSRVCRGRWGWW